MIVSTTYGVVRGTQPVIQYLTVSYIPGLDRLSPRSEQVEWLAEYNDFTVARYATVERAHAAATKHDGKVVKYVKTLSFE